MATDIDSLQIQINATATKANTSIDKLVGKLDRLSNSLQGLKTGNLSNLSSGVQQLGTAMQGMNAVKTADFTRLAKNLNNLSTVDYTKISGLATSIERIGRSFSGLSGVSSGASQMADLAKAISQLGYKSATQAITNIPQLATAMKQLMQELSKAPKVSQNLIDMTNALAKLARTGASSGRAATSLANVFDRIGKSSTNAHRGINRVTLSLSGLFKKLLPILSIKKIFDLGKQSVELASDLTEVQNVVDATFGNYKQKIEDLAAVSIPELGMSELTAKQLGSRFQAIGTALGFSQSKMADMSVELTRLTGDMASFYNVSQEDVGKALQSIFTGETEPMRRYGVDLTNATIQQWALNNGINANMSSMSQAEKAMLRYQYTMERTAVAQGDFARTAGTWANQVRILSENLKVLGSTVGVALINIFKPLITWLNNVMTAVISVVKTIVNALGAIFGWELDISASGVTYDDVSSGLDGIASSADGVGSSMGGAADKANELKKALMGFDEINKLPDESSSSGGSGGSGGGGTGGGGGSGVLAGITQTEGLLNKFTSNDSVVKWLEGIRKKAEPTRKALQKLWDEGLKKLANFTWTAAKDFYNNFLVPVGNWALGKGLPDLINATNNFLNNVDWDRLNKALERFWKALAPFATSIGNGLIAFYEDLLSIGEKFINTVVPGGLDALSTVLEGMDAETIEKIGYALGVVATSISAIKVTNSLITKLGKLFGLFGAGVTSTAGNTGKGTSGKLLSALGDGAKWLGGKAGSTVTSLTNSSLFSGLVASLGSILPSIGGTILPAIFDEESRNYMLNQWKEFFKTYEKLWKDSGLYEKAKDFSILGGGGILSLLFGSGEKEIKVSAKDETKEGIKSAKENLDTLPDKTSVAVDADTKTADKKIGALGTIFGKKGILVGVGIKTTEKQFTPKIQKLVKNFLLGIGVDVDTDPALMWNEVKALVSGKQLGIETSVATSAPIFRGFINNLVNGWNLGVGAKIGTSADVLQFDLQSHFKGFSAQVDAEANMKKLNDFLTTSDKTFDATANFKTGNDSLTKDKKTFETLAKFTKIEDKVPSENKFIKGILGYVNKTEAQAKKSLFLNGILGYVSNVQTQLNKGLSLKGILGYISEVKKDTSVASLILKGITGFVSALGGTEKANGGVFSGGSWKPITAYAGGGLPSQGQMFVAREAGPELVGTLGGHTAVMNNNQIVSSVSDGVYHAVAAAMSQFTGQMNGGGTPNITVYVGGRQVTDVVVEEVNQRTKATGMCPIMV